MNKARLTVIDILLFLLIMFQVNFFDLISLPSIWSSLNSNVNKYAILIVSLVIWLLSLIPSKQDKSLKQFYDSQFSISTVFFCVILFVVWLGTSLTYGQTVLITFQNMYWYFVFPFLYFGLRRYLMEDINFIKFDKIIVLSGVIVSVLYLLYSKHIITLHPNAVIDIQNLAMGKEQYGFSRFQAPSDFIFFVSFYMSSTALMKIKRFEVKYIFQQMILIANLFFVGQVRVYFAISLLLFVFVLFMKGVSQFKKVKMVFVVLGIVAGAALILLIIKKLNFFGGGTRQASSIVRSEEISYYLSHAYDNKFFGIGFPDINNYYYLIRGFSPTYQASVFYLEDVGIFGFIAIFGVLGIVYLVLFLNDLFKTVKYNENRIIMLVILLSYLATYFTLIPLNASRIMLIPFYLIIVTVLSRSKNSEKNFIGAKL
uniref:Wzy n=1 Tax=Leuconostoc mesenteroides TaxID=1245 RepID=A0A7S7A9S8_LEUME|nr:Wzy [Leuconostoc mesenteroides]